MRPKVIELGPSDYKRYEQVPTSSSRQFMQKFLQPIAFMHTGGIAYWLLQCIALMAFVTIMSFLTDKFAKLVPNTHVLVPNDAWLYAIYHYGPKFLALVLTIPLIIAFVPLSVRIIWIHSRFKFKEFLKRYMPSLQLTTQAIFLVITQIFLNLIPAMAILGIAYLSASRPGLELLAQSLKVISLLLFITLLYKTIPLLFTPLVCVCAQLRAEQAMQLCLTLFKGKSRKFLPDLFAILMLMLIEVACTLLLQFIAMVALTYILVRLSLIAAEYVSAFEKSGSTRHHVNTESQNSPGPVIINVQNLWVNKKQ